MADRVKCALVALIVFCLLIWSITPSFAHSTSYLQSLSERCVMIADHGHAHGDELDDYWTLHGHSHDVADHDHSSAILIVASNAQPITGIRLPDAMEPFLNKPDPIYLLDRPPRV